MNKVLKTVFAVFLLVALFVANTGMVSAALVTTYRPLGNTYATKPTYSWLKAGAAATYKLQVFDIAAGIYKVNMTVQQTACSAITNRCSITPNVILRVNNSYKWRVAAGRGAFSAWKTFKVLAGFSSPFTSNSAGWLVRPGGTWPVSGGTIHTTGIANKWSSISYNKSFSNFTYSARMKRVSTTGGASGFWVRGGTTFNTTFNAVKNGYLFLYSQNGCFSVWEHTSTGAAVMKQGWTLSPSIHANDWNTLKVVADGSALRFYINGALVWSGSDTSFTAGQVALTMYRVGSTSERLDVDSATLGMSELYKAAAFGAASETVEQGQVEIAPNASQPYGPEQAPVVP